MKCLKVGSWVAALALLAPALAQAQLAAEVEPVADKVECPLEELEWGIAQSFPGPWYSPAKILEGALESGL